MAIDFKYRIHEVAKDFGMTSKMIGQILTDYSAAPKNHMQVLEEPELDIIFEYLTQHNQVGSIGSQGRGPCAGTREREESGNSRSRSREGARADAERCSRAGEAEGEKAFAAQAGRRKARSGHPRLHRDQSLQI